MPPKDALGEFEHHVLLAILHLDGGGYTSSILKEIEERTDRSVSPAAVYIAIRRLERAGLVRTRMHRDVEQGERRERRYAEATAKGVALARIARQRLVRLWQGLTILTSES